MPESVNESDRDMELIEQDICLILKKRFFPLRFAAGNHRTPEQLGKGNRPVPQDSSWRQANFAVSK